VLAGTPADLHGRERFAEGTDGDAGAAVRVRESLRPALGGLHMGVLQAGAQSRISSMNVFMSSTTLSTQVQSTLPTGHQNRTPAH